MAIIHRSNKNLNQIVEAIRRSAATQSRADDSGISYWGNHELVPDADFVDSGTQLQATLRYGVHHHTLPNLHADFDPVGGTAWLVNNYSGGEAKARIVNLTRCKLLLSAESTAMITTAYEYEVWIWNNGRAYSDDLSSALDKAIWQILPD